MKEELINAKATMECLRDAMRRRLSKLSDEVMDLESDIHDRQALLENLIEESEVLEEQIEDLEVSLKSLNQ
jgi:cell division protein FtsB